MRVETEIAGHCIFSSVFLSRNSSATHLEMSTILIVFSLKSVKLYNTLTKASKNVRFLVSFTVPPKQ